MRITTTQRVPQLSLLTWEGMGRTRDFKSDIDRNASNCTKLHKPAH